MIINIFRRVIWCVMPHWQNTPIAETFRSLAEVLKLPVGQNLVSADSESVVFRYSEAGQTFYIKRFSKTRGLRGYGGSGIISNCLISSVSPLLVLLPTVKSEYSPKQVVAR